MNRYRSDNGRIAIGRIDLLDRGQSRDVVTVHGLDGILLKIQMARWQDMSNGRDILEAQTIQSPAYIRNLLSRIDASLLE